MKIESGGPPGAVPVSTRDRLINGAIAALSELTAARIISAVGTREIARRAGVSPASVFHHFSSVEALAEAVIARIYDMHEMPVQSLLDNLTALESSLPADTLLALHGHEFDRLTSDPLFRIRIGLWALGDTTMDQAYWRYLDGIDDLTTPVLARIFDSWATELRPPWKVRTYLQVQTAILAGAAIRHLVKPEPDQRQSFVHAAASLSLASLRLKGFSHEVKDRLRDLNHYASRLGATPVGEDSDRGTRSQILDAAADQFLRNGYERTKIGQVARAASLSESTVYSHFDSKRSLAAELFRSQTRKLAADRGVEVDVTDTSTDSDVPDAEAAAQLLAFVTVIVEGAEIGKTIAPAYLAEISDVYPRGDWIVDRLTTLVRSVGLPFRIGSTPDHTGNLFREVAQLILIAVIRRVLVLPEETARQTAASVLAVFIGLTDVG